MEVKLKKGESFDKMLRRFTKRFKRRSYGFI